VVEEETRVDLLEMDSPEVLEDMLVTLVVRVDQQEMVQILPEDLELIFRPGLRQLGLDRLDIMLVVVVALVEDGNLVAAAAASAEGGRGQEVLEVTRTLDKTPLLLEQLEQVPEEVLVFTDKTLLLGQVPAALRG
jgi:hypothetical protein